MQAKSPGEERALRLLDEAHVFVNPGFHFGRAISICYFVTKHCAQARLFESLCNNIKRTINGVGRGVVIDESRCAMFDSIHEAREDGILDALRIKRPIKRPP